MTTAAIRSDDRLRRRRADRVPIDGFGLECVGTNFDRVVVGVDPANHVDCRVRPLLVNRDDELHWRELIASIERETVHAEARRRGGEIYKTSLNSLIVRPASRMMPPIV